MAIKRKKCLKPDLHFIVLTICNWIFNLWSTIMIGIKLSLIFTYWILINQSISKTISIQLETKDVYGFCKFAPHKCYKSEVKFWLYKKLVNNFFLENFYCKKY